MRKVTKEEFYKQIGPLNVYGQITSSKWPYTLIIKSQSYKDYGKEIGRVVDILPEGKALAVTEYYLND